MTISLKSDASGNSGALQVAGVDRLTLNLDGSLMASANPATGARSMALATMQKFADEFGASLTTSGYQRLPSGLIVQWGVSGNIASGSSASISLPVTFPNSFAQVVPGLVATATSTSPYSGGTDVTSQSGFTLFNYSPFNASFRWIALGY